MFLVLAALALLAGAFWPIAGGAGGLSPALGPTSQGLAESPAPGAEGVMAYQAGTSRVPPAVLTRATSDDEGIFRMDLPEEGHVDLVTGTPKPGKAAEGSEPAKPEPALLEFVPSDAQGVVLRFAK